MKLFQFLLVGTLFISTSALAEAPNMAFSQAAFSDVSINRDDYTAIEYLRKQNIVKGYTDGSYKPDSRINRAEFVEFITNPLVLDTNGKGECMLENIAPTAKTVFFSDVSRDSWYATNVCFAKIKRIVDGYPDGTFKPGADISFAEAAKIISNVFSLSLDTNEAGEFWFKPYIESLSDSHAIPTTVNNVSQLVTRGQMAEMVYRLLVDSEQKSYMQFSSSNNTFSVRSATGPDVPKVITKEPDVDVSQTLRPNRRSVILEAKQRNAQRNL